MAPEYQRLSQHLLAGATGMTLYAELAAGFPAISRHDTLLGVSLAWSCLQADEVVLQAEIQKLRAENERLKSLANWVDA